MSKLLAPFLLVAGSLLLVAAILVPILTETVFLVKSRETAERVMEQIVRVEEQHFQARDAYLVFSKGETPEPLQKILGGKMPVTDEFVFDAFLQGGGHLVIRATTSVEKLKSGALPLMVFVYKKQLRTNKETREWIILP